MERILNLVQYGGIVIAIVAGTLAVLPAAATDKGRRLLVGVIVFGGVLSLAAKFAEDVRDEQEAREREVKEVARTRDIIVSGQQLQSMEVTWTFPEVPSTLAADVEKSTAEMNDVRSAGFDGDLGGDWHHERDDRASRMDNLLRRYYLVYPWIRALRSGQWSVGGEDDDVVMLVGLDESPASVLSLGAMHTTPETAGGIANSGEVDRYLRSPDEMGKGRTRYIEPDANVEVQGRRLTFRWNLPPFDLVRCMDRASPELFPTACPRTFRVIAWTEASTEMLASHLVFDPSNVLRLQRDPAIPSNRIIPWAQKREVRPSPFGPSEIVIRPNNLPDYAARYRVECLGGDELEEFWDSQDFRYGNVMVWEAVRSD